jgi:cyclophilin family peptidyl-prolyl cis-trans isomerase
MNAHFFLSLAFVITFLSACGGGSSDGSSGDKQPTPDDASPTSMSAKLLPDNSVRLTLSGAGTSTGPICVRQDALTPTVSDPCFNEPKAQALEQTHVITNESLTQRVVFTAWLRANNTVRRHASLSLPGKTCSAAAYAALTGLSTSLPAVCILTATGSGALRESVVLLEPVKAPISTQNFLRYVNQGFYDQTVFHRFLKDSLGVVQGGGFTHNGTSYQPKSATLTQIPLEPTLRTGLNNDEHTLAMARTSDPDSATAGFFVNTKANPSFNSQTEREGYAVFGRFIHGQGSWAELLASVPNNAFTDGAAVNPSTLVRLHWAYQIQ